MSGSRISERNELNPLFSLLPDFLPRISKFLGKNFHPWAKALERFTNHTCSQVAWIRCTLMAGKQGGGASITFVPLRLVGPSSTRRKETLFGFSILRNDCRKEFCSLWFWLLWRVTSCPGARLLECKKLPFSYKKIHRMWSITLLALISDTCGTEIQKPLLVGLINFIDLASPGTAGSYLVIEGQCCLWVAFT